MTHTRAYELVRIVDDMKRWYGVETFDEYLDTSIRDAPAGLYTFDVYPIYAARFSRPLTRAKSPLVLLETGMLALEAVSERSCRTDVPFWAFAAVVPIRNHKAFDNPMPTVAHLKFNSIQTSPMVPRDCGTTISSSRPERRELPL